MKLTWASVEDYTLQFEVEPGRNDFIQNPIVVLQPIEGFCRGQVFGVVPSGLIDGSNATFTTPHSFVPETVQVFRNGLLQYNPTHFTTTSTTTINLNFSPIIGDILTVNYTRA